MACSGDVGERKSTGGKVNSESSWAQREAKGSWTGKQRAGPAAQSPPVTSPLKRAQDTFLLRVRMDLPWLLWAVWWPPPSPWGLPTPAPSPRLGDEGWWNWCSPGVVRCGFKLATPLSASAVPTPCVHTHHVVLPKLQCHPEFTETALPSGIHRNCTAMLASQ